MANNLYLPISKYDVEQRGWDCLDVILITGDAYVDHPSYGVAVIGRYLESKGYRVGIISQPDWRDTKHFMKLGRPRLYFGITAGNVDSMIANYTSNKIPRKTDDYSPEKNQNQRPDRAVIVYANRVRECYKDVPIVIGGLEASLRRLAHYDYWDDKVRRSILLDSRADILVYGMGERQILEITDKLSEGETVESLGWIRGTAVVSDGYQHLKKYEMLPSFEDVSEDKDKFNEAFRVMYNNMNPFTAKPLVQKHQDRYVIQYPPALPFTTEELDEVYDLKYVRHWHPIYNNLGGVRGYETVKFSIVSHRGCPGECSFCSLYAHQGRIVQSRSAASVLREAEQLAAQKYFKGTITDVGGPSANLFAADCANWTKKGFCKDKKCLGAEKCKNLKLGYESFLKLLRRIKEIPNVKHVFVGSGFRYDLLTDKASRPFLEEIMKSYISGQMKVAPEHVDDSMLKLMNKPKFKAYDDFYKTFQDINKSLENKVYAVNYFIMSHPGETLKDALNTALFFIDRRMHPEQIQDYIPLPMTASGAMYHTGKDPFTGETVYVPKTLNERVKHRALVQYKNPGNKKYVLECLEELNEKHMVKYFFIT